jgi:hypothetical protein
MEVARPSWPSQPRGPRPDRYRPRFFPDDEVVFFLRSRPTKRGAGRGPSPSMGRGSPLRAAPYVLGHGRANARETPPRAEFCEHGHSVSPSMPRTRATIWKTENTGRKRISRRLCFNRSKTLQTSRDVLQTPATVLPDLDEYELYFQIKRVGRIHER